MFISENYRKLNRKMHESPRGFGADGRKWIDYVQVLIRKFQVKSLLDYGCGQATLWKALKESYGEWGELPQYVGYDPCVKGRENIPQGKFDLVVCTDVLEHIEPEYLKNVVWHIRELAGKAIFLNINIHPANKTLPDGRNTHLILKDRVWWFKYMKSMFVEVEWNTEELQSKRPDKDYIVLLERRVCPQ
jgi:hypothetical protein